MREGWGYDSLGSLCKTGSGGTPLKSKKEYYYNGNIPWLRSGEVNNRNIVECDINITETGLNNSSAKIFPPGTVLIAMYGATAGQVGILNFACSTNQAICGILPNQNFIPEFLYYFFLDFKNELISQAVGNAQPNISQAKIKDTLIPIISIEKQKQIVAILDRAFTAINQAKTNIEINIENAKELFQSKLNEIFSQKGDGWEEKKFKEVCVLQRGFDLPRRLREKGNYELVSSSGISDTTDKFKVVGPGVVTGRSGSIGKVFYIENNFWPLNTTLYIKEFHSNTKKYIYYFLQSFGLERFSSGAGVPTLNRNFVHDEVVFSTYNQIEQLQIVKTLDHLNIATNKMIKNSEKKIQTLEELKKSILQKAFAGELTNKMAEV